MSWRKSAVVVAAATGLVTLVDPRPPGPAAAAESEPTLCSDLGSAVARQPNGRIVVGGSTFTNEVVEEPSGAHDHVGDYALVRYLPNGRVDRGFGRNGRVITDFRDFDAINALVVDHGAILAVGTTRREKDGKLGERDIALARYNADGDLDPRFGHHGRLTIDLGDDDVAADAAVDRRGRLVVVGQSTDDGDARGVLLRLTRSGRPDRTFGDGGQHWPGFADGFHGVELGRLGRIVVAGNTTVDGNAAIVVARFTDAGRPHTSFGGDGRVATAIPGTGGGESGNLALRAGRILATLDVTSDAGSRVAVVRHLPGGSLEARFGDDGRVLLDPPGDISSATAATIVSGNRAVLSGAGYPGDFATGEAFLTRLTGRGDPDVRFGDGGTTTERFNLAYAAYTDIVALPGGSTVAVGWDFSEGEDLPRSDIVLSRYTSDGSLDPRFGDRGVVFTDVRDGRLACEEHHHEH